jgi:hypothetical protein
VQTPLTQSALAEQVAPLAQRFAGAQLPPQSTAVSVPFFAPSPQVGSWQNPPVHTALSQSVAVEHRLLGTHFEQVPPPQSMSVSVPFLTKSVHAGVAHFPEVHTPLWQSDPLLQTLVAAQAVAQVAFEERTPPQSTSVSVPFLIPSGHFDA